MRHCHAVSRARGTWPGKGKGKVRVVTQLPEMTLEQIKEKIPRMIYESILLSVDILLNDGLRSQDPKKKHAAAAEFMERMGDASFLKNLAALKAEVDKDAALRTGQKTEWGKDKK
jgi:hypothetical protein